MTHRAESWDEYDRLVALFDAGELDEEPEMPDAAGDDKPVMYVAGEAMNTGDILELLRQLGVAGAHLLGPAKRRKLMDDAGLGNENRAIVAEAVAAYKRLTPKPSARRTRLSDRTERRRAERWTARFKAYVRPRWPVMTGDAAVDQPKIDRLYDEARRVANADRSANGLDWVKVCRQCGETFESPRSDAKYCSAACRAAAHRGTDPNAVVMCADCGRKPVESARSKYCGDVCRAAAHRKRQRRGRQVNSG